MTTLAHQLPPRIPRLCLLRLDLQAGTYVHLAFPRVMDSLAIISLLACKTNAFTTRHLPSLKNYFIQFLYYIVCGVCLCVCVLMDATEHIAYMEVRGQASEGHSLTMSVLGIEFRS